jgi:hypothetical protein
MGGPGLNSFFRTLPPMNCNVLLLQNGPNEIHLLSPFTKEELKNVQSRSELFIGQLNEPAIGVVPGNISYNKDFLVHMHALVRDIMVNDPQVIARAEEQPNGFVFIVDRRSPGTEQNSEANVDKQDIIGIFVCHDRKTDVSKYRPNPDYVLISEKGIGQFPPAVEEALFKLVRNQA